MLVASLVFGLLGAPRAYAATQEQVNAAIKTLTTTEIGTKKPPKNYWEVSGDSVRHALIWDTTFAKVNLAGTKYARADLAYRVFDDGSKSIFAEFLNTQIPRGMTMQFVWDDGANGTANKMYNATLGLNNGYDPMRRTYIFGDSPEFAHHNSTSPSKQCSNRYDAVLQLLSP